ncbi:DUF262 domain-containing protein [Pantoea agglomerans]|uniref:DUF262 domain-containing protein n=1 Tax=Enterobacter agglomerans TaxID=549 RepID=UPI003C7B9379
MNFIMLRLGRDSVNVIKKIDSIREPLTTLFSFDFTCKQVEGKIVELFEKKEKIFCFIYLGSDNNKGISTPWKRGLRAIAQLINIKDWIDFQSETILELKVLSVFPRSYDQHTFLEESPLRYKEFSNYPIIGLSSSRNNSVQLVNGEEKESTKDLINSILELYPNLRLDLISNAPDLIGLIDYENTDVIEGYEDNSNENPNNFGWGADYPLSTVLVRNETRTISEVMKRIDNNRYKLDPDFQRDFVWSEEKQSKLIESCLMRIPLPVFYVAEDRDGRIIVVDGLQRLTTFKNYLSDKFAIKYSDSNGLNKEAVFLNKKFSQLPVKLQERIEDTQLIFYILDEKAPERAKLDIFERVNGGTPISRQQMRNCLYNGKGTQLLRKISLSDIFLTITGKGLDSGTMRDREVINRFFAFKIFGFEKYQGDMDAFLAEALLHMNGMDSKDIEQLEEAFYNSLVNNHEVFGHHSFRKSLSSGQAYINRSVINVSIFDVFSVLLADLDIEFVKSNKIKLKESLSNLLLNQVFIDSVTIGTNSKVKVNTRFNLGRLALEEIL